MRKSEVLTRLIMDLATDTGNSHQYRATTMDITSILHLLLYRYQTQHNIEAAQCVSPALVRSMHH